VLARISLPVLLIYPLATALLGMLMVNRLRRERNAEKLLAGQERIRLFFERQIVGMAIISPEKRWLQVNDEFCRMVGCSREELAGFTWTDFTLPDDQQADSARFAQLLSGAIDEYSMEKRFLRKDGSVIWTEISVGCVRCADGTVDYVLALLVDISERKRTEEERERLQTQLLQAQKMESIGRLAGGVAHDFNNMLQTIMGYCDLSLRDLEPTNPLRENLQEISRAATRSADLTRQLLAFARQQTVVPKVLDLNDTVAGMLNMLQRLIGENIDLSWLPGYNLWKVKVDPSQIDQILANFAINARDAIADTGRITIETENVRMDEVQCAGRPDCIPGDYVLLAVSDNGCGMDKETMAQVFEPFFTTKEQGKGTGLGLATVYGTVRQSNGFIGVYSEPGQGTTFKIYLPRFAETTAPAAQAGQPEKSAGGTETVLLVEDEAAILNLGTALLRQLGYTVLAAGMPTEALRLAQEHPGDIHLLITDVVMPEMNGRDLARQLALFRPQMRCLYMSGYTADVISQHGVLDAGIHFIQKPFSLNDLAGAVRGALESATDC
jgi:two-component system sensor histidine kinase EvgS